MQPIVTQEEQDAKFRGWCGNKTSLSEEQAYNIYSEYAIFLEDGDLEKWQPCCDVDSGYSEEEWNALRVEAMAMDWQNEPDPRKRLRILWIQSRFYEWGKRGGWYENYCIRQPLTVFVLATYATTPWIQHQNPF